MSDSFYPIVDFLSTMSTPYGKDRNTIFFTAHIGFLVFNIVNVLYLLFFEGIALGRLMKNHLSKLAFIACSFQIWSCVTSIRRYNIDEEYNVDGQVGVATGLVAFFFSNVVYLYVCFHKNYRKVVPFGVILFMAFEAVIFKLMMVHWDDKPRPTFFKINVAGSSLFHIISNVSCMRAVQNGEISIDPSILSKNQLSRVFGVVIFLELAITVCVGVLQLPIQVYPGTGATFSLMVIIAGYVGRMDFMTDEAASPAPPPPAADASETPAGESTPLIV